MSRDVYFCKYCNRHVRPIKYQERSSFITQTFKGIFNLAMVCVTAGLYLILWGANKLYDGGERCCPICNARM